MNIALFPSAFHPSLGGVEELSRQLAHALKRRGHGVIILTNRWPRDLPSYEQFEGLEVHRLAFRSPKANWKARLSFAASHRAIVGQTVRLCRDCDLLHVQCVAPQAFYALEAASRLKLPLVTTSQGERTMDATRVYERSRFLNSTLRRVVDCSAQFSACSLDTLHDLERWRGQPFGARGRVIENGIRVADFENAPPFESSTPFVFALGRMVPQKGFDLLIDAWSKADLSGWKLLIAGDGPQKSALQDQIEASGRDDIELVGRATRPQVASYLAGCEFFVLPSRHEPQGIVNLEAMAAGRAVLAADVGGVSEIVDASCGVLVAGDSAPALALGLKMLADNPPLRQKLGAAGALKARQFDWDAIAVRYETIYEAALSR